MKSRFNEAKAKSMADALLARVEAASGPEEAQRVAELLRTGERPHDALTGDVGADVQAVDAVRHGWWVYVIQSEAPRYDRRGKPLPGFYYVGMSTDPDRRLVEHNTSSKGAKYTAKHRPWVARSLYGPYASRSEALRAEMNLKHKNRGVQRTRWTPEKSSLCKISRWDHDP